MFEIGNSQVSKKVIDKTYESKTCRISTISTEGVIMDRRRFDVNPSA